MTRAGDANCKNKGLSIHESEHSRVVDSLDSYLHSSVSTAEPKIVHAAFLQTTASQCIDQKQHLKTTKPFFNRYQLSSAALARRTSHGNEHDQDWPASRSSHPRLSAQASSVLYSFFRDLRRRAWSLRLRSSWLRITSKCGQFVEETFCARGRHAGG